jgi:chaperonin cofactor prefoldin
VVEKTLGEVDSLKAEKKTLDATIADLTKRLEKLQTQLRAKMDSYSRLPGVHSSRLQ